MSFQIVIDTREQEPYGFSCATVSRKLEAGDYSVVGHEDAVTVERKSLSDFVHTVIHDFDRFAVELKKLSAMRCACVVVEADLDAVLRGLAADKLRGASPTSVLGAALYVAVRYGVPVYWCGSIQTVIERLLCISGEDALTIDRKHKTPVTMKLPTRFMFMTNELPRLNDASGALAGRFLILQMTKSFYGEEDKGLTDKLLEDLPGILNWAIEGWKRLRERGHFIQPPAAEDAMRELEDLSSPVGAFVRERCELIPGARMYVDDMYAAYKTYIEGEGWHTPATKPVFGRDLIAAVPGLKRRRHKVLGYFYEGIALKEESWNG